MHPARTIVTALAAFWLCVASCSDPYSVDIENINFREDDSGYRRFYADIPGYYNRGFYHFLYGSRTTPMLVVQSRVKKVSGFYDAGYGVVFCMQDSGDYYRVLIKTNGTYSVTRKAGGVKTDLIDWTTGEHLKPGYDIVNEIMVTYDQPQRRFAVFFNGAAETSYVDTTFSAGYTGFYAIIGPAEMERFPDEPVDVRFKQLLPVPDPR